MRNSRVIHIEEGRESDVFERFIMKHPFLDAKNIDHIAMDMSPSYISGAEQYLPDAAIVFDHFHVIKMMNDALDKIRRRESKVNEILKNTLYGQLKNPDDLTEKEKKRLFSIKSLDLKTSHAYHFKLALQRLWHLDIDTARTYLRKWISWAYRSRMPEIIKLGKTIKRHLDGILDSTR